MIIIELTSIVITEKISVLRLILQFEAILQPG